LPSVLYRERCCIIVFLLVLLGQVTLCRYGVHIGFAAANAWVDLSVSEARDMIDSDIALTILDVRNQSEYDRGHIGHSKLIPLWQFESRIDELDKHAKTLVYCSSGYRSPLACEMLENHSFSKVYNIVGGIEDWSIAGYPVYVHYSSLQEAVNTAAESSLLYVGSGTYHEYVAVNKTISLIGEDAQTTVIDGSGIPFIVEITAPNVTVSGFTLMNSLEGVYLRGLANSCSIKDCKMVNNRVGVLVETEYNLIAGNVFANNNDSGIKIFPLCPGCYLLKKNIIKQNEFLNNSYGLWLDYSLNTTVFHNNFIDNTYQVHTLGSTTTWDDGYPSGGNYWNGNHADLFRGSSQNLSGSDGIDDIAYMIDTNNIDKYPLAGPSTDFEAGTWNNVSFRVEFVSNFSVSDFQFDPSEGPCLSFSLTGPNETSGFCRTAIPKDLLWAEDGWTIHLGGQLADSAIFSDDNKTYLYISSPYSMTTAQILGTHVIPEFRFSVPLLILMAFVSVSVVMKKASKPRFLP